MGYNVDWGTRVITIPTSELILLQTTPTLIYKLDLKLAHKEFRFLESTLGAGMTYSNICDQAKPKVLGGILLAGTLEILAPYTITFEDGQYAVNLDGYNTNLHDRVNVNQVSIRPNNSAGLQDLSTLLASAYQGRVVINTAEGQAGIGTPIGTLNSQSNNVTDSITIAKKWGLEQLYFQTPYTLTEDVAGYTLEGNTFETAVLDISELSGCDNTIFKKFKVSGTLGSNTQIRDCETGELLNFDGNISGSRIGGNITLSGNSQARLDSCSIATLDYIPSIICNDSGESLVMTNYAGYINIENLTGDSNIGVGLANGVAFIDSTCTAGRITVLGTGEVIDNSGIGCYVIDKTINGTKLQNVHTMVEQLRPHHTSTGDIWYWNPYGGNDEWDGDHPDRAFKTFTRAHDAVGNANHDTIVIVPGDPSGLTVVTEQIVVTKDYLFLRGVGRDTLLDHRGLSIKKSIHVQARGFEMAGFRVSNDMIDSWAVYAESGFVFLNNIWTEGCYNGAYINTPHPVVHNTKFTRTTGISLKLEGNIHSGEIRSCVFDVSGGDAINVNSMAGSGGVVMKDCSITKAEGYGINLSTTTSKFIADSSNTICNNTLGNINDLGEGNTVSSTELLHADIATAVWSKELPG